MNSHEPAQFLRYCGHRLKHWLYDYSILLSFVVVLMLVVPCAISENARTPKYLIAVIGIGGSFSYFLLTHHTEEVKLFKELFEKFNQRYNGMNEKLNAILAVPDATKLTKEETDTLYDYFNLCGEEHLYFMKGFIYPEVWAAWLNGMHIFYRNERIQKLWDEELKTASYYGMTPDMLCCGASPACWPATKHCVEPPPRFLA